MSEDPLSSSEADVCEVPFADAAIARAPAEATLSLRDESPEAVLAFFEARGWGDGLPLVAPTEARVAAMLGSGCRDEDPDEVLSLLPPRFGKATRRIIAVNAVLAGCPPGVLPVLVSAVRALARPELNLRGVNATTHPVAPLLIVGGEAVDALGFNAGLGTFGPGNRINATVGRALRLVLLHVAGARPGAGDASTQGQPAKYTYCIAENRAASPWPDYARSEGIEAASTVTLHCGENPHNFHDMENDTPEPILDKAASVMATLGSNNAPVSSAEFFVVLGPEHAATIAASGWGRDDIRSYLHQRAALPARVFRAAFDVVQYEPWELELADDEAKPITASPGNIKVLVAGGAGKHSCVIPSWGMTKSVTLPVRS